MSGPARRARVLHVAGARPNFIKIAPVMAAFAERGAVEQRLVHTGQHYDDAMSRVFFDELGIPRPDVDLGVGSGSHAEQTAKVMVGFEPVVLEWEPDLILVVGDVNSTVACSLVAAKLHVPVAHVEAGLRSFDRSMPEEVNRIVTDRLSDLLFTTERSGTENLLREGVPPDRIHFVGNVMIDTLLCHRDRARAQETPEGLGLTTGRYALVTLHRPGNVDRRESLAEISSALSELARELPVVFPVHPRTRARIDEFGLEGALDPVRVIEPVGYLEFLGLMDGAGVVLTDSGGIQEETTALGVPCLTIRPNTERPVTVSEGTNRLVPSKAGVIVEAARAALSTRAIEGRPASGAHRVPELWDGRAAERIERITRQFLEGRHP